MSDYLKDQCADCGGETGAHWQSCPRLEPEIIEEEREGGDYDFVSRDLRGGADMGVIHKAPACPEPTEGKEGGGRMMLRPVTYREACAFIRENHRHHQPPQGWRFGIGVMKDGRLVGVLTAGRPVARRLDQTYMLEITRLCTDGTKNACSKLYAAAARAALAMGYRGIITYTLETESGSSLKAAGFRLAGKAGGKSWNVPSRPRIDKAPPVMKCLWEFWANEVSAAKPQQDQPVTQKLPKEGGDHG